MDIAQAPHGINLVVETDNAVYIGRMGKPEGDKVRMHHAATFNVNPDQSPEALIRETAKYGVPVAHLDLVFAPIGIRRIRKLGDIPKA